MGELFEAEQRAETSIHADSGPEITLDEVRHAVIRLKNYKTTGPGGNSETFGRHPT